MNEEELEIPALEEEENEETQEETTEEAAPEETTEELKARLAHAEELAENQKKRAEKAESKLPKEPKPAPKKAELEPLDLYALMNAKVPQEDVSEVTEYAKLKGISITEALNSNVVRTILAEKAEERATAEATAVGTARRSSSTASGDALLQAARKGQLPESEEDIKKLLDARMGIGK